MWSWTLKKVTSHFIDEYYVEYYLGSFNCSVRVSSIMFRYPVNVLKLRRCNWNQTVLSQPRRHHRPWAVCCLLRWMINHQSVSKQPSNHHMSLLQSHRGFRFWQTSPASACPKAFSKSHTQVLLLPLIFFTFLSHFMWSLSIVSRQTDHMVRGMEKSCCES